MMQTNLTIGVKYMSHKSILTEKSPINQYLFSFNFFVLFETCVKAH